MTKIVWTVQPVNDGYQGFLKVDSDLVHESNRAWFSVSEDSFPSELAAQMAALDAAYRLGVKIVAKFSDTLPNDTVIEKA